MKNNDVLKHMQEDAEDIQTFIQGCGYERFVSEPMIRKAVCMSLINLGELTKSLSTGYKARHPEIPWRNIAGLRDVTAHKYHTLNLDVIWAVATIEIPKQKEFINHALE